MRVFVVDDTILYRKAIKDVLATIKGIEVIGSANNGKSAIARINTLKPDLVTLDIKMPKMDGLEVLQYLRNAHPEIFVIMISDANKTNAAIMVKALELGAFDFITKPNSSNLGKNLEHLKNHLEYKIKAAIERKIIKSLLQKPMKKEEKRDIRYTPNKMISFPMRSGNTQEGITSYKNYFKIVVIGISTGGPSALSELLASIPSNFMAPIIIIQHMPPLFTTVLAELLNKKTELEILEITDGMILEAGKAYIAPGGKQSKVIRCPKTCFVKFNVNMDPPVNNCRPSIDYLCDSIAEVYGKYSLGIIMTGMGSDGVRGLARMKKRGAKVIAQDKDSCVVFGMPMEAIKHGIVDLVLPLKDIAKNIIELVNY